MSDFDATAFLDVTAELLTVQNPPPPSYIRTAANRAYYSQYGLLRRTIFKKIGNCFQTQYGAPTGKHGRLYKVCKRHADQLVKDVGHRLEQLCVLRMTSDYTWDEKSEPPLTEAEAAWELAMNLQPMIGRLTDKNLKEIYDEVIKP
jgi:hypothetical protein